MAPSGAPKDPPRVQEGVRNTRRQAAGEKDALTDPNTVQKPAPFQQNALTDPNTLQKPAPSQKKASKMKGRAASKKTMVPDFPESSPEPKRNERGIRAEWCPKGLGKCADRKYHKPQKWCKTCNKIPPPGAIFPYQLLGCEGRDAHKLGVFCKLCKAILMPWGSTVPAIPDETLCPSGYPGPPNSILANVKIDNMMNLAVISVLVYLRVNNESIDTIPGLSEVMKKHAAAATAGNVLANSITELLYMRDKGGSIWYSDVYDVLKDPWMDVDHFEESRMDHHEFALRCYGGKDTGERARPSTYIDAQVEVAMESSIIQPRRIDTLELDGLKIDSPEESYVDAGVQTDLSIAGGPQIPKANNTVASYSKIDGALRDQFWAVGFGCPQGYPGKFEVDHSSASDQEDPLSAVQRQKSRRVSKSSQISSHSNSEPSTRAESDEEYEGSIETPRRLSRTKRSRTSGAGTIPDLLPDQRLQYSRSLRLTDTAATIPDLLPSPSRR